MDVSIVIVNWNGSRVLRDCLVSLLSASQGASFEIVVVDNASTDDSVEVVEHDFPAVRLIKNARNCGFAAANNQAFTTCVGRYVVLLNSDTIVAPETLGPCVQFLDANRQVGVLGCRVQFPDGSYQTSCYRFNDLLELLFTRVFPLGSICQERFNRGRYWGREFSEPTDVDVVAGCFMMVRAEVIEKIGGFDEDFFMYGEDEEWCSRIKRSGWDVVYFPGVTITHIHRFSSSKARRSLRLIECLSPVLVLHKRRGCFIAWCSNALLLFGMLLRFPAWLINDLRAVLARQRSKGVTQSRFIVLGAHLKGLFWPVWLPTRTSLPSAAISDVPCRSEWKEGE